ncbi:unnamed protein product [Amoebophrya sp. A120]|nr:unnamed protein product [Amoebophrya sp. A120]|eukprot:GSA120T00013625001.1
MSTTYYPAGTYQGHRPGYVFKLGDQGQGYYQDLGTAAAVAAFFGQQQNGGAGSNIPTERPKPVYNKFANDGSYYAKITAMLQKKARIEKAEKEKMAANGTLGGGSGQQPPADMEVDDPVKERERQQFLADMAAAGQKMQAGH